LQPGLTQRDMWVMHSPLGTGEGWACRIRLLDTAADITRCQPVTIVAPWVAASSSPDIGGAHGRAPLPGTVLTSLVARDTTSASYRLLVDMWVMP